MLSTCILYSLYTVQEVNLQRRSFLSFWIAQCPTIHIYKEKQIKGGVMEHRRTPNLSKH